jgi:cytochrome c oxidase subunit I+III
VFAFLFLWTVRPGWLPEEALGGGLASLAAAACLLASSLAAWAGARAAQRGQAARRWLAWGAAIGLGLAWCGLETAAVFGSGVAARDHAYGALVHALWVAALLHVALAILMAAFLLARCVSGHAGPSRPGEIRIVVLFWHYAVALGLVNLVLLRGLPWLGAAA